MFWHPSDLFRTGTSRLILGECKAYNRFESRDFRRMETLAEAFPGSVLVFCTMRDDLTAVERRRITSIARRGRAPAQGGRWRNPVMVLTGWELFAEWGPPETWKETPGVDEELLKRHLSGNKLEEICEATQRIHLGMESWWEERRQKRRPNRVTKA
jgi:hypothetical protein